MGAAPTHPASTLQKSEILNFVSQYGCMQMSQGYKLPKLITDLPNFEDLALRAAADPLGLIDHCMRRSKEYDEGAHWMHWSVLISLYAAALVIDRDPDLIAKLLDHSCFKGSPYRRNGKHVLRLVFLAGQGIATKGRMYKNACHDASMIQPFFKDRIEPVALFSMIEAKRGLRGLAQIIDPSDIDEPRGADDAAASDGFGDAKQSDDPPSGIYEQRVNANRAPHPVKRKIAEQVAVTSKLDNDSDENSADDEAIMIKLEITKRRLNRLNRAPAGSTGHIFFERTASDDENGGVKITSLRIDR